MKIYIYGLINPLDPETVRYVGRTEDLGEAVASHAKGKFEATAAWAKEACTAGSGISAKILETKEDETGAEQCEAAWISRYPVGQLLNKPPVDGSEFRITPIIPLKQMQARYIRWAIERFGGNKQAAADALGIRRQTLYNILKRAEK